VRILRKDKISIAITVAILTTVLVALMFVQFKTIDKTNITEIENMQESELRSEMSNWKTKYNEITEQTAQNNKKIQEYNNTVTDNQNAIDLLNSELAQSNMLLGKTEVSGEGIVVRLRDNDEVTISSEDLVELVNELRYAGAEAISINDERIVNITDIVSIGERYILINGNRVSSTYEVKAIGNQTYLSSTLNLKNDGYIDRYNNSGKTVSLMLDQNINIPAYGQEYELKYIKGE